MLETTKQARAKAFDLRKAKRFAESLVVLRNVWEAETAIVGKALLKLDAAYAYSGLKYYPKAEQLLQGLDQTVGLGEKPKASIRLLLTHIQSKKVNIRKASGSAKWVKKKRKRYVDKSVIHKKYLPAKYKSGFRPGWRKDVGL